MKVLFQKITASFLTLMVFISAFSFTVEKHYCGSFLVDIAVFSEAKGCGMERFDDSGITHQISCDIPQITRKSCCKDEKIVVEGQDVLKLTVDSFETAPQLFSSSLFTSLRPLYLPVETEEILFKEYDPPNLVYDFQVVYETFLI